MNKSDEFADQIEIQAAADYFGVNINIYTAKKGAKRPLHVISSQQDETQFEPIDLWYERGFHYHAIASKEFF